MTKYRNYSNPYNVDVQRFSIYDSYKEHKGREMQVGDELVISIKEMDSEGRGVGYHNNKKVIVPRAVLGEKVRVLIKKVDGNLAYASVIERLGIQRK
ncbi:MAG: hypothetical protein B7O98_03845 [Zestosphaera tikiterensis]|uniref:TRAM domain-containing protein n=1 Tax=Zestosphaera tikiterensis TaxID=1973259 RepID=A0A2R7Y8C2_9CREN|nr:MAG: hypothetical protein B7O98_03845 [Zestosphaera tikiterensis]